MNRKQALAEIQVKGVPLSVLENWYKNGMTYQQIAENIGCCKCHIWYSLKKYGIWKKKSRISNVLNGVPVHLIGEWYDGGMTLQEVGDKVHCTRERVRQVLKEHGYKTRSNKCYTFEKDVLKLASQGFDEKAIAKKLEITRETVIKHLSKHNLLTPSPKEKVRDRDWLYKQYVTLGRRPTEIAKDIGCRSETILRNLREMNIPRRPLGSQKSNRHRYGGLTYEAVEKMKTSGMTIQNIADTFGCHPGTVSRIIWLTHKRTGKVLKMGRPKVPR